MAVDGSPLCNLNTKVREFAYFGAYVARRQSRLLHKFCIIMMT